MKKILNVFILIFVLNIICCSYASAEKYTCKYKIEVWPFGSEYFFDVDTSAGTIELTDGYTGMGGHFYFNTNEIKDLDNLSTNGKKACPVLFMGTSGALLGMTTEFYFYMNSYDFEDDKTDFTETYTLVLVEEEEENEEDKTLVSTCYVFSSILSKVEEEYQRYEKCDGEKESCGLYILKSKNHINELQETCRSVLNNRDVMVAEGLKDRCVDYCLNVYKIIDDLKIQYGVKEGDVEVDCGFSQKLIIWIANIVKWLKYIIPVIAIVLGILDFIKAIASSKDDEMKKAQGRFIKRIIAAAIIFITPFIIEFVLDKMGFEANGCGIIDL